MPAVQAIRDGDRAMLLAIGGVLAGVGANVIARRMALPITASEAPTSPHKFNRRS